MFPITQKSARGFRVCLWMTLGSLVLLGGAVLAQVPEASFVAGRIEYPFSYGLVGMVQGDFNGDGKMDVAAVNAERSNISLLLSTPRGGYTLSETTFPEGGLSRPQFLAAADFDGDGKLDLAVTGSAGEGQNNVLTLKGDGTGVFTVLGGVRTENAPRYILAADVNGDGRPDLVVCNSEGQRRIQVFLGQTGGTFATPVNYPMNDGEPRYIAASDFDGDQYMDLAISVYQRRFDVADRVILLFGTGGGQFDRRSAILLPSNSQPEGIVVGDFNGDSLPDLAVATTGDRDRRLYVYHNRNSQPGTFSLKTVLGSAEGLNITTGSIAAGDFNGDNHLDLALGTNDRVSVVVGNAEGLFEPYRITSFYAGGYDFYALQVADFNGDGKLDLAVSSYQSGNITVLYGNGDATFDLLHRVGGRTWAVAAGDFNGDGIMDIATANRESGEVSIWHGDGQGGFVLVQLYPTIGGVAPEAIAVADFNGDDILDIVTANNETNNVTVLLGDGKGGFSLPTSHALLADFLSPKGMVVGEFTNDDKLDLAVVKTGDTQSAINVFPGTGEGIFRGPLPFPTDAFGSVAMVAEDFDGDGRTDLATVNFNSNTVSVLLRESGNPPPSRLFQPARRYLVLNDQHPSAIATADLDGDECPDLVIGYEDVSSTPNPVISVMKGERMDSACTGQFAAPVNYDIGLPRHSGIIVADLNGDGRKDLAVIHREHHSISILLGQPDGSFKLQPGRIGVGQNPTSLIVADFNGDGIPDLAAAGSGSSDFIVLFNNTPQP